MQPANSISKTIQICDWIELNSHSILIKLDSNSIEEKWDEIWWKMYWNFFHDYGVEKETLKILMTIN
jgi:hypothetical protein